MVSRKRWSWAMPPPLQATARCSRNSSTAMTRGWMIFLRSMTMATGLPETPAADATRWAAEQFDLGPEASAPEVRAAFLRSLPDEDFVPPESWQQAIFTLAPHRPDAPPRLPLDDQVLRAREEEWRTQVEAFAGRFFTLA